MSIDFFKEPTTICEAIRNYYARTCVRGVITPGAGGGESSKWEISTDDKITFLVSCSCPGYLPFASITVESPGHARAYLGRKKGAVLDPETATVKMTGLLGLYEHEISLPRPD